MPSPLAHAAMGFVVYRVWPKSLVPKMRDRVLGIPTLLMVTVGFCMLADLDASVGILVGDLGRYHNQFMGSPVFGVLAALAAGGVARLITGSDYRRWTLLALVCYQLHVVMDYFTIGRGVKLLWPLSDERFKPPFELFYGLRWSDGPISERHLWTLLTESIFILFLLLIIRVTHRGQPLFRRS